MRGEGGADTPFHASAGAVNVATLNDGGAKLHEDLKDCKRERTTCEERMAEIRNIYVQRKKDGEASVARRAAEVVRRKAQAQAEGHPADLRLKEAQRFSLEWCGGTEGRTGRRD